MSFKILLQDNTSAKNKIGKTIKTVKELTGTLRDGTSIINPVIQFRINDIADLKTCNYMTIPAFRRKYFVTDIKSVRNNIVEISAHVDVLETYGIPWGDEKISKLDANTAIIARSSQSDLYNAYLDDNLLATYQDSYVVSYNFPQKFSKDDNNLILCVAGASAPSSSGSSGGGHGF